MYSPIAYFSILKSFWISHQACHAILYAQFPNDFITEADVMDGGAFTQSEFKRKVFHIAIDHCMQAQQICHDWFINQLWHMAQVKVTLSSITPQTDSSLKWYWVCKFYIMENKFFKYPGTLLLHICRLYTFYYNNVIWFNIISYYKLYHIIFQSSGYTSGRQEPVHCCLVNTMATEGLMTKGEPTLSHLPHNIPISTPGSILPTWINFNPSMNM